MVGMEHVLDNSWKPAEFSSFRPTSGVRDKYLLIGKRKRINQQTYGSEQNL